MKFFAPVLLAVLCASGPALADQSGYNAPKALLDTRETTTGQELVWPKGQARVTSLIVTLMPGQETGRHRHPVPTLGYLLDGELTISYDSSPAQRFVAGEALIEALNTWHNGRNTGSVPARVLVFFAGVDGVAPVEHAH